MQSRNAQYPPEKLRTEPGVRGLELLLREAEDDFAQRRGESQYLALFKAWNRAGFQGLPVSELLNYVNRNAIDTPGSRLVLTRVAGVLSNEINRLEKIAEEHGEAFWTLINDIFERDSKLDRRGATWSQELESVRVVFVPDRSERVLARNERN